MYKIVCTKKHPILTPVFTPLTSDTWVTQRGLDIPSVFTNRELFSD